VEEITIAKPAPGMESQDSLQFEHFPGYARFIRENHLVDYIKEQLNTARALDTPLLRAFNSLSDEQIIEYSIPSHTEFLTTAEENRLRALMNASIEKWVNDKLDIVGRDEIEAEDITQVSYVRKKALLNFLPHYTSDPLQIISIVREIDTYHLESDTRTSKTYIDLLRDRVNEHAHFIESITNTTPGLSYLFSLQESRLLYVNKNLELYLGYSRQELLSKSLSELIHQDDLLDLQQGMKELANAEDKQVIVFEYRLRNSVGQYRWMKNYASVFKRGGTGEVIEVVGMILDINNEKRSAQLLEHREAQLLEAQEIADLGSFEWDLINKRIEATPQLLKILDLDQTGDMEYFMKKVHPGDKAKVTEAMEAALGGSGQYECEYRLLTNEGKERIIWSRGVITFEKGVANTFKGTVMDVTEKHHMVQRLQRSEHLYKQAQALSKLGNWTWDLVQNKLNWSEELFRIYDLPPETEITYDLLYTFNHPDDAANVSGVIRRCMETHEPFDMYYRIVLKTGTEKILHAKGEVLLDEGKPFKLLGTLQDVTERQLLIEKLQESEELYKEAQARTHIGNWSWDIEKDNVKWSDEMYRIYGLEPQSEEVSLDKYLSFISPDERENRLLQIKESMESGKPSDFYFNAELRDGTKKIVHSKTEIAFDDKGKAIKMVGTCQDVTERQNLIERLQHSDFLYKQAQALSHIGNWTWNIATGKVTWTEELYRIFGFQDFDEEITFDRYLAHIHAEDRDLLLSKLQNSLKTNEPYDFYHRLVLDNGTEKIVQSRGEVLLDRNGQPYQMVGTAQDVTKQQLAEQQLWANREFIQKITNTTPSIICSYSIVTGRYTYINKALENILGYDLEEVFAKGVDFVTGLIHPDDLGPLMEKNAKALEEANANPQPSENEMVVEFKYRVRHKNGTYRWFHTYGTIFDRDSQGRVEHLLNVSVDITEQEEAELSLYQKNLQLQQSNASLEEYAYVASHDLKEPLRKISTFSDRLITTQYDKLSEDGKLYINKIIESSRRMQTMISDLLSVSVISGNKAFEVHSLKDILEEVVQTLEFKIEDRMATVVSDELPAVRVVPSQFRQLFQNLISNSLKFSREGVAPRIEVTHQYLTERQGEKFGLGKASGYLRLDVTDNGIGFDNQFANKIFTIFQRLHGKTEYEGTGIGLAICKKIAENHGGTITANGTINQGSTFTIIIPV